MDKSTIASLIAEHKSQLHMLAYEKHQLQLKQDELDKKLLEFKGIVAALEYVSGLPEPEPV